MSIVYHGTTIDSTGQVNYTKNGVTTNLTKVYYRKNGVDTLVWSKERNQAAVSNSVVSASGGTTLNYLRRGNWSPTWHTWTIDDHDHAAQISSWEYTNVSGNSTYGTYGYLINNAIRNIVGEASTVQGAKNSVITQAENSGYIKNNYYQTTTMSYFDYTTTVRTNLLYASRKHIKIYCNNVLTTEQDVSTQTDIVTATYRDNGTLTSRNATIPLKIEIYDMGGTLEETWTGTMASSATITYEG